MLASSPSPSTAALRSPLPSTSGSHSHSHYEPAGAPQFNSPRSSRLAIDELRSALNRHTVDPSSPETSGDLQCRRASTSDTLKTLVNNSALASTPPISHFFRSDCHHPGDCHLYKSTPDLLPRPLDARPYLGFQQAQ
ncbi:hypothetical protein N7519_003777 [Penicillium mononematosum]|uniref:uncharacterized protein n=1 Tax=Penicillium mononematosum TaxID=268346 RepID=UPI0025470820|nr:uncharacterized protein N7519_003777 [Penicillium mononematosum]KAJ6188869.1 hypothetical protein N7519_003777 [Penicillium mononematosum]